MPHKYMGVWWPLFQEPSRKLRIKGYRRLQPGIRAIAKPIVEAVPKHVKRISHDRLNFFRFPEDGPEDGKFDPETLENEVLEIMTATIKGDFRSNSYPKIRPTEDNLRKYGITSRNPRIAFIQVLISTLKDTFKAIKSRNMKDAAITEKWAGLTAGQIARKYGYNQGRQRNPEKHGEDDAFQAGFVHREVKLDITRHDFATPADTDHIEHKILFQQFMDIYKRMHRVDQLAIRTQVLANTEGISFEAAYRYYQSRFNKVGITTCRGAKKRYAGLDNRYPEYRPIKEAMNN